MLSLITEFVLRLAYWRKPTSFSAPSKAHSSQLLLPHSHPRRLSESSCTETTCSFSTVCITLPQKRDKVNRNSSCLIRFLQKSLRISCHLFYTTPPFFIPHQRSAAPVSAPASVGAGRSPPGRQHPRQQPRPSPSAPATKPAETLGFSPVFFLHVLYGNGVHFGSDTWFSHPFAPVPNRCHPPQAPKTHPTSAIFRLKSGAFRCFLPSFDLQKFRAGFSQTSGLSSHSYTFILTRPCSRCYDKDTSFSVQIFSPLDSGIIVTHGHNAPQVKASCKGETHILEICKRPAQPCGEIP